MRGLNSAPLSPVALRWSFATPITGLHGTTNDHAFVALGNGCVGSLNLDGEITQYQVHKGAILSSCLSHDGESILTAGDDGQLCQTTANGETTLLAAHKNRWIEQVCAHQEAGIAYSYGNLVQMMHPNGTLNGEPLKHPSAPRGLAFNPKGKRLAVTHYNGVSLWWVKGENTEASKLNWKGSHLNLIWHPDGTQLITSMQEPSLHGWRLSDMAEMRMQGYLAKIHSMGWSAKGKWLFTSGAERAIGWPFFGGGPWNKTPLLLAEAGPGLVSAIAPHPKDELCLVGYDSGLLIMAAYDNRPPLMLMPPDNDIGSITQLIWSASGSKFFAATNNGHLMQFTLESVAAAFAN